MPKIKKKYDNKTKKQARIWAWDRLVERIPSAAERRRARIYVLIGDTTKELEIAQKKGFSPFNVIGVDVRDEPVKNWRKAGGLAIQAPIETVLAFSKYDAQGVIADFCGGINATSFATFATSCIRTVSPGGIVINLLRGRDSVKSFGITHQKFEVAGVNSQVAKKRSVIILNQMFQKLCKNEIDRIYNAVDQPDLNLSDRQKASLLRKQFNELFEDFCSRFHPQFYEYKSEDSNQYFDTLAINALTKKGDIMDTSFVQDKKAWVRQGYDVVGTKRKLAALEAVRTMKLQELSDHKRRLHSRK